ncbi:MAG: radical SAM protein [Candidatus Thorarchaeota archaeon]|nr:radical SAM protein [Candidatus Thorarchaeota archaeon]
MKKLDEDSLIIGQLPTGCRYCTRGAKLILFVTGLCDSRCFYCPLSEEKANKDVVFADEMPVMTDKDILLEADAINAEGAGLTGGDPLCRPERTVDFIRMLKSHYDHAFHIHLYTSQSSASKSVLSQLADAGLDEIRFHPQSKNWDGLERSLDLGMEVGIEVPAMPSRINDLKNVAARAEKIGVSFLNINELESSETNFAHLVSLGMKLRNTATSAIEGSAETAFEAMQWAANNLEHLSIHYCSSRFKDAVQLRNRLSRRLDNVIRKFEERDESDPLLILGVIRAPYGKKLTAKKLEDIASTLSKSFDVPSDLMSVDYSRMRIEIAGWILEEIASELRNVLQDGENLEIGTALEYPSWDRLQVLFEPL